MWFGSETDSIWEDIVQKKPKKYRHLLGRGRTSVNGRGFPPGDTKNGPMSWAMSSLSSVCHHFIHSWKFTSPIRYRFWVQEDTFGITQS